MRVQTASEYREQKLKYPQHLYDEKEYDKMIKKQLLEMLPEFQNGTADYAEIDSFIDKDGNVKIQITSYAEKKTFFEKLKDKIFGNKKERI